MSPKYTSQFKSNKIKIETENLELMYEAYPVACLWHVSLDVGDRYDNAAT